MDKKHLKINAGIINLTDVHPEALEQYETIEMNCGMAIVTPEARKLLAMVGAQINTGTILDVPQDANIIMVNGKYELRADTHVPENSVLIANGHMRLHPGAQNNLSSFIKIIVNGSLVAPESMRGQMGNMTINGNETFYPDEAEYVEGNLQLTRRFCRFVQENSVYFATGAAILVEKNVDVEELLSKNVIIHAKKAYIASGYPDGELLFSPKTHIVSVPEGYTFIQGNLTIDESTAWSQGTKLFVVGNVTADAEASDGLKALEEIIVHGTAKVHEDLMEFWQERCKQAAKVKVIDKSRKIEDMNSPVIISRELLEMCESGLRIADCNTVEVLPDVELDLLSGKLLALSCVAVCQCTKEQQSVLQLVSDSVNFVRETPAMDKTEDENTVVINAGSYKL
ncbi:MAG: hypothetical protein E7329_03455 [Clostridiales bacterium]|nr:hypothetical protein [Clostridiales bacterium]